MKTNNLLNIREFINSDIEQIRDLWRICFALDDTYLNRFFNSVFFNTRTIVATEDNRIVSSLSLFPVEAVIKEGNNVVKGSYMYGVCTDPQYRNRGLSSDIIQYIIDNPADDEEFIITRPASDHLFSYYIKRGFNKILHSHALGVNTDSAMERKFLNLSELVSLTGEILYKYREEFLSTSSVDYIRWSVEMLDYILSDIRSNNGIALNMPSHIHNTSLYFMGYPDLDNNLLFKVLESNSASFEEFNLISSIIKEIYPETTTIEFISPVQIDPSINRNVYYKEAFLVFLRKNSTLSSDNLYFNFPME